METLLNVHKLRRICDKLIISSTTASVQNNAHAHGFGQDNLIAFPSPRGKTFPLSELSAVSSSPPSTSVYRAKLFFLRRIQSVFFFRLCFCLFFFWRESRTRFLFRDDAEYDSRLRETRPRRCEFINVVASGTCSARR